jgi:hypothetical protein
MKEKKDSRFKSFVTRSFEYATDKFVEPATDLAMVVGSIAAFELGIYGAIVGGQYLVEKTMDELSPSQKKEIVVKFKERKQILLLGTHGKIDAGNFETLEGKTIRLSDAMKVSARKCLPDLFIYKMKKDSTYKVQIMGNDCLGYTIIDAEKVKNK